LERVYFGQSGFRLIRVGIKKKNGNQRVVRFYKDRTVSCKEKKVSAGEGGALGTGIEFNQSTR